MNDKYRNGRMIENFETPPNPYQWINYLMHT